MSETLPPDVRFAGVILLVRHFDTPVGVGRAHESHLDPDALAFQRAGRIRSVGRRWSSALMASIAALLIVLLASCDSGGTGASGRLAHESESPGQPPARKNSLRRTSESGVYRVEVRPEDPSSPRDELHAWLVRIETLDGRSIRPGRLAFSAGMPQHGHGLPTAPHVTDALPDDWFRVSGIRFHMPGEWTLRVEFVGPSGPDVAIFQVDVPH